MIELVISVCLISTPSECKDVHLTYVAQGLTPYSCLMRAQPKIAKWSIHHPRWSIRKWHCADTRLASRQKKI
ncbi:hypothetical protein MnTg02_03501 [bacterium MnTg02]|nr:hypothetical protein MnTg02_03501 [bacterium MnTg02]